MRLDIRVAVFLVAIIPQIAVAKLGEDMPALTRRFGSNYRSEPAGRYAEEQYIFESKNLTVRVFLSGGHSVSEIYYGDRPLVNGRPPEAIWRAVREKNVPKMTWMPDGRGGFVSGDRRYTSWFHTEASALPTAATYAIGISDLNDSGQEAEARKAGPVVSVPGVLTSPRISRDDLLNGFLDVVARCYPTYNAIQYRAGNDLVAVHPFFTQYAFASGAPAREIFAWILANRSDLDRLGVKRVGLSSPEGSEAFFELAPGARPVMNSHARTFY